MNMLISRLDAKKSGKKYYFNGIPCSRGGISKRLTSNARCLCVLCVKAKNESNKVTMAKAYELEPDKFKNRSLEYYFENKKEESFSIKRSDYRFKIRDIQNKYNKEYRTINRKRMTELHKNWISKNPVNVACRRLIERLVNEKGIKKTASTMVLLGYSHDDLKIHIESLFLDGMSWENYGEWHIDHIKPIALMIRDGETSPSIINALSNLQPLWAKDNLSKGSKWLS